MSEGTSSPRVGSGEAIYAVGAPLYRDAQPSAAELTRDYLARIMPPAKVGKSGFLIVVTANDPYEENGKYKHRNWHETPILWPDRAEHALALIEHNAPLGDVYICPYLMKTPHRRKGNAAWRQLVHSDVDAGLDLDLVRDLGGFIVWSGSPGHGHIYIPLKHVVTVDQHRVLCEGLRARLGGDDKICDNDLLRPPGTFNFKPTVMNGGGNPALPVLPEEL